MSNSRFAVSIHILTLLATKEPEWKSSECIADSVNTNPVVIRRALGDLKRMGMVRVAHGTGGGWRLNKPAEQIMLSDIYDAVKCESLFPLPPRSPSDQCCVGKHIERALTGLFEGAEEVLRDHLRGLSIADVQELTRQGLCC